MGEKVLVISSLGEGKEPLIIHTTRAEVENEYVDANAQMISERDGEGITPITRT